MEQPSPSRRPDENASPPPLLGTAPTKRTSRYNGFTFSRPRLVSVAVIVVLVVVGALLPYLTMPYITFSVELATKHATLFPAAEFIRAVDPLWLPDYQPGPMTQQIVLALNVFNLGPSAQEIGVVIAVATCWSLFQDEINKFFWWPLHLSGWLLTLGPVLLLVGAHLLHRADVSVTPQIGWVPLGLAGVFILVTTLRARGRMDSYRGI